MLESHGMLPTRPHPGYVALYRFFGRDDQLLYVGICDEPIKRWYSHAKRAWWPDVATFRVVWYPTREEASEAEGRAIVDEGPAHNVVLNGVPYNGSMFPGARLHELAWSRFGEGPFSYTDLSEEVGVPYGSAVGHVRRLEEEGAVLCLGKQRGRSGKPRLHFALTRPPAKSGQDKASP